MSKKIRCPECGHNEFRCKATVEAVMIVKYSDTDYEADLLEWDYIESMDEFECLKCGFEFLDEDLDSWSLLNETTVQEI